MEKSVRPTLRVWHIDENPLFQAYVTRLLQEAPDLRLVGSYSSCEDALAVIEGDRSGWTMPDVILSEIRFTRHNGHEPMSGFSAISVFKQVLPKVEVIFFTTLLADEYIQRALVSGAVGYLSKNPLTSSEDMQAAIHMAHRGGLLFPPNVARRVLSVFKKPKVDPRVASLTRRELEIIQLMGQGKKRKHIADALYLSANTVDSHLTNIYQKLEVKSGMEAVARVFREGLLE